MKEQLLSILNQEVMQCKQCTDLVYSRTKAVLGHGNIHAEIVFVGEAPGRQEDNDGIPFVGKSGKLINNILTAFNIKREDVYMANVCHCRPPQNRMPTVEEIKNCGDYLQRELAIIKPKYVVALGTVAAQKLLNTDSAVGKLRGKIYYCADYKIFVFYHPSYIIRNISNKKFMYDDMKLLVDEMMLDKELLEREKSDATTNTKSS